jgi:uncharacterized protein (TIGR02147 family)
MNVYRFENYKDVLKAQLKERSTQRGIVSRLAQAAGCQRSYLSQVLNSHVHLTPDHAFGICDFFGFNETETAYFLALVDHARAGSPAFKARLKSQMKKIRDHHAALENRISAQIIQGTEMNYRYYSTWLGAAVHIAVSIPELQTLESLAEHFQVPRPLIQGVLQDLNEMGLIRKAGDLWTYVTGEQHLARKSALIALHHGNWRSRATLSAQLQDERNYHYTGISSVSRTDAQIIADLLLQLTEKIRLIVAASKEEELVCLNLDFFRP